MPTPSAAISPRTLLALWVALVACVGWCGRARAAVEAQHPGATIRIPIDSLPREVQSGDVTILAWVWHDPSAPGWTDGSGSILSVPGALELRVDAAGRIHAALLRTYLGIGGPGPTHGQAYEWPADQPAPPSPRPTAIAATTPRGPAELERLGVRSAQPIAPRQWTLIAVSVSRTGGSIALHVRSAGTAGAPPVTAGNESWRGSIFQPDATVVLGAASGARPAMPGAIGLIAVRSGPVTAADVDAIAAAPSMLAGIFLDNRPQGGTLNGPAGVHWATNHALAALPVVMTTPGPQASAAAIVGAPVTRHNVITTVNPDNPYFFATVRRVDYAEGFIHRSHHDAPYAGRFGRTVPGTGIGPGVVPGPASIARELIDGPTTLRRVIISANSRAVKFGDGSGTSPGNFPHGFIELYRSQTAGVLMRPALIGTPGNPWFGFDCKLEEPNQDYPRVFNTAAPTGENHADFSRFFTGSAFIGRGPGWGLFMRPTAFYALKCKPEPGSLMTAEHSLTVEAYLLRFPGASPVAWRPERGMSQRHVGDAGDWSTPIAMDTTRYARSLQIGDAATTTTISLAGDLRGLILSGDAVFVASGPAAESISAVQSVGFNPGAGVTAITLQRPFNRAPAIGAELRFGPWSFLTVEHTFPGVAQGDPNTWRGLRFRAENAGGGTVVYAFSAFRPGVSGFAWGGAGWGGHGYTMQLNAAIPASNPAWMALTKADIWLQVPAQQGSAPASMNSYLAHIRAALPDADVVWAGESGLAASNQADWHAHILNNAAAAGVVGLSSLEHPDLGNVFEQYADGMLGDADHFSQRGNLTMARVWMSLLATALRPRCIADLNNDGSTDLADYFAFLDAYDNARPEADLNRDGSADLADFFAFLHAYDTGC